MLGEYIGWSGPMMMWHSNSQSVHILITEHPHMGHTPVHVDLGPTCEKGTKSLQKA